MVGKLDTTQNQDFTLRIAMPSQKADFKCTNFLHVQVHLCPLQEFKVPQNRGISQLKASNPHQLSKDKPFPATQYSVVAYQAGDKKFVHIFSKEKNKTSGRCVRVAINTNGRLTFEFCWPY